MPRWTESDDFRRLLRAFEQVLPLRRVSDLAQRPFVQFLISAGGGLLDEVSRLLGEAAEQAILDLIRNQPQPPQSDQYGMQGIAQFCGDKPWR